MRSILGWPLRKSKELKPTDGPKMAHTPYPIDAKNFPVQFQLGEYSGTNELAADIFNQLKGRRNEEGIPLLKPTSNVIELGSGISPKSLPLILEGFPTVLIDLQHHNTGFNLDPHVLTADINQLTKTEVFESVSKDVFDTLSTQSKESVRPESADAMVIVDTLNYLDKDALARALSWIKDGGVLVALNMPERGIQESFHPNRLRSNSEILDFFREQSFVPIHNFQFRLGTEAAKSEGYRAFVLQKHGR